MPRRPDRPSALAWQVFRASEAIRAGLVTAHRLHSSAWVNLRRDIYADSRLDSDHVLACRAASLQLPPGAMIAGPSAALLHGVEHAAELSDDVHVASPRTAGLRSQRGLRVHLTDRLPASQCPAPIPLPSISRAEPWPRDATGQPGGLALAETAPVPVAVAAWALPRTDPTTAAWETAVWLEPLRAVGIIDSLLRKELTTRDALTAIGVRNAERPGGRRARWVFDLADPGAQSPPESELRVRLVLAGLPRPLAQHPIRLASGIVEHLDLTWPTFRVAVEHDGRRQADIEQLHRDRQRFEQLVGAGWLVLHVTSQRLRHDFPAFAREVHAALASRGWRR
ncbi:hypothetical protein [Micromonospora sp. RTGN7]|uniref:endonuclease domain-containing protein n=1 Tax=Micromonospora sp. RTGN7 TaxID=3016526 RepID=UPI0029FF3513|nr:hypothetical protein [Micromonospora sp. RTGN7]